MKAQSITRQDLWLLDTILRAGKISFEEINQRCRADASYES